MNLHDIPLVGQVLTSGPDDRIFDSLLLLGPVLLSVVAFLGRSLLTLTLGMGYLLVFWGYVIYK